jgi:hypothetical protein
VQQSVDAMQPGLFLMILQQVWAPSIASVEGLSEEKLLAVATCRCLAELQPLQQAKPLWDALQQALAAKLQGTDQQALGGERAWSCTSCSGLYLGCASALQAAARTTATHGAWQRDSS